MLGKDAEGVIPWVDFLSNVPLQKREEWLLQNTQ